MTPYPRHFQLTNPLCNPPKNAILKQNIRSYTHIISIPKESFMNSLLLLGHDTAPFLIWWAVSIIIGIGYYPIGAILFRHFNDRGWLFSKALGIGIGGYLMFVLGRIGLLKFQSSTCIAITLTGALICWILFMKFADKKYRCSPDLKILLEGELLFLLFFFIWTYCSGFRPEALGTEKPMDYGFMAAMMRSEQIPAKDIWYSEGILNYYYGGQYYAVYLTKLTLTRVNETYHLMRALVAAFCFSLSWSIVRQALKDRTLSEYTANLGGLFAGAAVSLAGNVHYLLYGLFGQVFKLTGYEDYWFPSSTRYIGHNPLTEDQCIHEFPSYSFVLGDLHAHVVNLFLVLAFIGIMYAWFQNLNEKNASSSNILRFVLAPHVITAGILIGIYKWTNYWDFIIYFTVFIFTAVCIAFRSREKGSRAWILQVLAAAVFVGILQSVIAYPFTSGFVSMFKGVGFAQSRSLPHQLLVLWGVPVLVSILLAVTVVKKDIHATDVFFVMLSICGIGLIMIPELVYVRDIYEGGYSRTNTMFKLTYQAYVMLGLMMSYAFFRILCLQEKKEEGQTKKALLPVKVLTALSTIVIFLTFGYFGYSVYCWFGNVFAPESYKGLDAAAFAEESYPEDADAIRWLERNIKGQPVVLEATGDSYSNHCRVSSITGLPTVEGWYVHEWLWRDDPDDLNSKKEDIRQIYTNDNTEYVTRLLDDYDVTYIFVGSCEREEYGEDLKEEHLKSLGTVCFEQTGEGAAYIIYVK